MLDFLIDWIVVLIPLRVFLALLALLLVGCALLVFWATHYG